jgi:trigger factor
VPRQIVETRFAKHILEELGSKLVRESLNEAIREKKLKVLSVTAVEKPEFAPDDSLRFEATVIIEPEFELPDYASIPATISKKAVEEKEVTEFLDRLREPHASFDPVEGRASAMGDFAVVSYAASFEGKPLLEAFPDAPPQVAGKRNAWLLLSDEVLAPGFSQALAGMEIGAEKTFSVTFPEEFVFEPLRGKSIDYTATLHAINAKNLPALDDALADKIDPGSTVETLTQKIRERLENMAEQNFEEAKRQAALSFLGERVTCELPESFVANESRNMLREIVYENRMRGISDEEIQKHQDELVGAANKGATERVRTNFLLLRVAREEKITVTEAEMATVVYEMAQRYEIPIKKFVTDLKKKDAIDGIREQVLARKALDLLAGKVTVTPAA